VTKFELDAEQMTKLKAWAEQQDQIALEQQKRDLTVKSAFVAACHEAGHPYYGATGGVLTYSFTPTSLGVIAKVCHGWTEAEIDLTDYESW